MSKNRRKRNRIPECDRGEPQLGDHKGPRLFVLPYHTEVHGSKNQVCLVPGEVGDGTPIWCVGMLWKGESTGMSDLPDGPAWAYTFQAARKWADKKFSIEATGEPSL